MVTFLYFNGISICSVDEDIPIGFILKFKDHSVVPAKEIKLKTVHKEYVIIEKDRTSDVSIWAEVTCEKYDE